MKRTLWLTTAIVAFALVASACGSSTDDESHNHGSRWWR